MGKRRRISRVPSSPSAAPVGEGTCRADPLTLARDARRTFSPTGRSPHTPRSGRNGQLALRGLYIRDSYAGATQLSPGCCEGDGIGVTTGDFSESFLRDKKDSAVLADELELLDRLRECDDIVFADSLLDGGGSHDPSSLRLQADHLAVDPPRRIVADGAGQHLAHGGRRHLRRIWSSNHAKNATQHLGRDARSLPATSDCVTYRSGISHDQNVFRPPTAQTSIQLTPRPTAKSASSHPPSQDPRIRRGSPMMRQKAGTTCKASPESSSSPSWRCAS